jgi:hypothetical protein
MLESWVEESLDASPRERVRAILRRPASVIAVVDGDRRFKSLVDRLALLEQAAAQFAEVSERD